MRESTRVERKKRSCELQLLQMRRRREKVSGENPVSMETGENHEKIIFKNFKKFLAKMYCVGNVKFYRHAKWQVETLSFLGDTKMTNSDLNTL